MTALQKTMGFLAGLLLAFGAGLGLGEAVDPVLDDDAPAHAEPAPGSPGATHGEHQP